MSSVSDAESLVSKLQKDVNELLEGLQRHLDAGDFSSFTDDVTRLKYLLKVLKLARTRQICMLF